MSQASYQAVGLLALISGCMDTIYKFRLAPEHDPVTIYTQEVCDKMVGMFPTTGKEHKLQSFIDSRMNIYDKALTMMPEEKYDASLLTAMAIHILLDLKAKIRDPKKLELIEPIYEAVVSLNELVDPNGKRIEEFERGEYLVSIAYQIFGFEPKEVK